MSHRTIERICIAATLLAVWAGTTVPAAGGATGARIPAEVPEAATVALVVLGGVLSLLRKRSRRPAQAGLD